MQQPIRIISRSNKRLYADAIPGHFATNHSHINYYIDMSEIKHNMAMALEAARSIAFPLFLHQCGYLTLPGGHRVHRRVYCQRACQLRHRQPEHQQSHLSSRAGQQCQRSVYVCGQPPPPHDRTPKRAGAGQHRFHRAKPFRKRASASSIMAAVSLDILRCSPTFPNWTESRFSSLFSGADFPHYHNFVARQKLSRLRGQLYRWTPLLPRAAIPNYSTKNRKAQPSGFCFPHL